MPHFKISLRIISIEKSVLTKDCLLDSSNILSFCADRTTQNTRIRRIFDKIFRADSKKLS